MFGRDATILSKKGNTWIPRVFHDTQISKDRGYIQRVYGETSNETVIVHIRSRNGLAEGKYTVYEPKAWDALQDTSGAVSFKAGDILWLGNWEMVDPQLSPVPDDDYPKGVYAYLRGKYDCTYSITNIAEFATLPHWEIAGR